MAAFYRQFGWPEAPTSVPEHVVFQCTNGVVLGPVFRGGVRARQFGDVQRISRIHADDQL